MSLNFHKVRTPSSFERDLNLLSLINNNAQESIIIPWKAHHVAVNCAKQIYYEDFRDGVTRSEGSTRASPVSIYIRKLCAILFFVYSNDTHNIPFLHGVCPCGSKLYICIYPRSVTDRLCVRDPVDICEHGFSLLFFYKSVKKNNIYIAA